MAKPPQEPGQDVDVLLIDIISALEMLAAHGQYEKFKAEVEKNGWAMIAGFKTKRFVQKFIVDAALQDDPTGARIVGTAQISGAGAHDCKFGNRRG